VRNLNGEVKLLGFGFFRAKANFEDIAYIPNLAKRFKPCIWQVKR
jgi:hypothetical protein